MHLLCHLLVPLLLLFGRPLVLDCLYSRLQGVVSIGGGRSLMLEGELACLPASFSSFISFSFAFITAIAFLSSSRFEKLESPAVGRKAAF
jgi:hypothetical protein